jgi:hypothetical protein
MNCKKSISDEATTPYDKAGTPAKALFYVIRPGVGRRERDRRGADW